MLTTYDGDEDVYRAVHAGARGYLLKDTFPEGMLDAIRDVHAGEVLFAEEVAAQLADRGQRALAVAARAVGAGADRPRPVQQGDPGVAVHAPRAP